MKFLIFLILLQGCATTCECDWKEFIWQAHKAAQTEDRPICYSLANVPDDKKQDLPVEMLGPYCLSKDKNDQ